MVFSKLLLITVAGTAQDFNLIPRYAFWHL